MLKKILILIIFLSLAVRAEFVVSKIDIMPGSEFAINVSLYKANYSYNFNWVNYSTSEMQSYQLNGKYWLSNYRVEKPLEDVIQFYKRYCQKKNGTILHSDNNNVYFNVPYPAGFITWVHLNAFDKNYKLSIVEVVDPKYQEKIKVDSSKTKKSPDAIVYFSENKSNFTGVYQKEIIKIHAKMERNHSLIVELHGFASDEEGNHRESQQLIKRRILQIKKELILRGIPLERIFDFTKTDSVIKEEDAELNQKVELYLKQYVPK